MVIFNSNRVFARSLCLFLIACAAATSAVAQNFYIRPHIQNVTVDGATLIWETPEPEIGAVEYGKPGALDQKVEESAPVEIHRVRMTGLAADTEYAYRVKAGADEAAATSRPPPARFSP